MRLTAICVVVTWALSPAVVSGQHDHNVPDTPRTPEAWASYGDYLTIALRPSKEGVISETIARFREDRTLKMTVKDTVSHDWNDHAT